MPAPLTSRSCPSGVTLRRVTVTIGLCSVRLPRMGATQLSLSILCLQGLCSQAGPVWQIPGLIPITSCPIYKIRQPACAVVASVGIRNRYSPSPFSESGSFRLRFWLFFAPRTHGFADLRPIPCSRPPDFNLFAARAVSVCHSANWCPHSRAGVGVLQLC